MRIEIVAIRRNIGHAVMHIVVAMHVVMAHIIHAMMATMTMERVIFMIKDLIAVVTHPRGDLSTCRPGQ